MKKIIIAIATFIATVSVFAGAVPCLTKRSASTTTSYAEANYYINQDGTLHMEASNAPTFYGVDTETQLIIQHADGRIELWLPQWHYNVHTRVGMSYDAQVCGTDIISITITCNVYQRNTFTVLGHSEVHARIP